ncbi:Major facilitator superfamily domain general substrate transporter [Penicillium mononematosum]|uniref:Major facilitator superfamily domain general substrate transporter n=1 Tax=Penicillium mononematosum TaxID=268346 RepID=UPI0025469641|nr:Major facilitator superfamily domain general substrate transporter [Penicillium mononematosum]KAJ6189378.1 Major facilitator superfamily domain general substrate transporter [Penicillium mononematosum]
MWYSILGRLDANTVATTVPSIINRFHTAADVGYGTHLHFDSGPARSNLDSRSCISPFLNTTIFLTTIAIFLGFIFTTSIGSWALVEAPGSKRSVQAAVQTTLGSADINLKIGVTLSGQHTGLPAFIAIGQVVLTNKLLSSSADVVPGLTPTSIEQHTLGDIKNGLPIQRWYGVLGSIDRSSTHT